MSSPIFSTRAAYWRNHIDELLASPNKPLFLLDDLRALECRWNELMGMYRNGLLFIEEDHLHRFLEIISEDESEDEGGDRGD